VLPLFSPIQHARTQITTNAKSLIVLQQQYPDMDTKISVSALLLKNTGDY